MGSAPEIANGTRSRRIADKSLQDSPQYGSFGPQTLPGAIVTTGTPTSWSSRAIVSECAFDRA
jgi:hypothetical protein